MRSHIVTACVLVAQITSAFSFTSQAPRQVAHSNTEVAGSGSETGDDSRRGFLAVAGALISQSVFMTSKVARAEEGGDMTSQLFNPDGSLKEGQVEEAKFKTVGISWASGSDTYSINIDGSNAAGTETGSQVRLSYKTPEKWQQKDDGYYDKSTTNLDKVCH
jgi:hypothetical protein